MEVATVLVWVLRVVLPIVLFWIYFKLQLPKDGESAYAGSTKHVHARSKLLDYRKNGFDGGPPLSMENVRLVSEAQAPALFATSTRRGGGRNKEKREPRKADKEATKDDEGDGIADAVVREGGEATTGNIPEPGSDDKMHLESLLNYVAFNRKEQQRTFIVDETGVPPPPPPPPKKATVPAATPAAEGVIGGDSATKSASTSGGAGLSVSPIAAEKANAEAQMVLKGAIEFQRADVVRDLYEQLVESEVEISEGTFTLMIKASTLAEDLKTASDLLAKMEASGHCPDSELLDKVMDLYSSHKKRGATIAESTSPSKGVTPLSSGAQMFQPCAETFSIAFQESAVLSELGHSDEAVRVKLSSQAPVFVPSVVGAALGVPPPPPRQSDNADMQQQRTALCAKADSFQPKGLVSFDPQNHTWTVAGTDGDNETEGKDKTGKGNKGKSQEGKGGKSGHQGGKSEQGGKGGHGVKSERVDQNAKVDQHGKHAKAGKGEGRGKGDREAAHTKAKALLGEKPDDVKPKDGDRDMAKKRQTKEGTASTGKESQSKAGKWQAKAVA